MDTGVNSMNASSTRAAITTATVSHVRLVNITPLESTTDRALLAPLSLSALLALLTGGLNVPTQLELIACRDGPCQLAIRIVADEMLTPSLIAMRC